ncbi:MAG: helix-turn-helix domain-containing protein [Gemmataceae bacterium]|nr:helix-turn-helix domain-containing protein [Gemmataceae bacterium]
MPPDEPPKTVRTPAPRTRGGHHRPPSDALLARVAEARAEGTTWPAVAARLGKGESTIRRWPRKYPDRWLAAMLRAERRQALDSGAEAVLVLRTLLRSADPKLQRDAAKLLIGLRVDLAKLDVKAKFAPQPPALTPEVTQVVAFLNGHSDAELAELAREFLYPALPAGPGPTGPAVDPGPG